MAIRLEITPAARLPVNDNQNLPFRQTNRDNHGGLRPDLVYDIGWIIITLAATDSSERIRFS